MSKSLRSFPEAMRPMVVKRRLAGGTKGNGYWAAADAAPKFGITVQAEKAPLTQLEREERDRKRDAKAVDKIRRNHRAKAA